MSIPKRAKIKQVSTEDNFLKRITNAVKPKRKAKTKTPEEKRIDLCTKCSLNGDDEDDRINISTKKKKVLIIGNAPTAQQCDSDDCFSGKSGKLVYDALMAAGFSTEDFAYSYAVKCSTPSMRLPIAKEITSCRGILSSEIEKINPELIVVMGKAAYQSLYKKKGGVRGKADKKDGRVVINTHTPLQSTKDKKLKEEFFSDIKFAKEIVYGEHSVEAPIIKYSVFTAGDFEVARDAFNQADDFTFDVETSGLSPYTDRLVTCAVWLSGIKEGWVFVLDEEYAEIYGLSKDDVEVGKKAVKEFLADKTKTKIGHNTKFDYLFLRTNGLASPENFTSIYDTRIRKYIERGMNARGAGLKQLVWEIYRVLYGIDVTAGATLDTPLDKLARYNILDCYYTWKLSNEKYDNEICPDVKTVEKRFQDIIIPLAEMEVGGMNLDIPFLKKNGDKLKEEINRIELVIEKTFKGKLNLSSPKSLSTFLFETVGYKPIREIKTGYSTDVKVLKELVKREKCPICKYALDHRAFKKFHSTYVEGLISRSVDSVVHTTYKNGFTGTGRLSSADPNLQNQPRADSNLGKMIRRAIEVPDKSWIMAELDYSQVELRVLGAITGEEVLINTFMDGGDIHIATAKKIFQVAKPSSEQRTAAKTVNFGVIYGMGYKALAEQLGISERKANKFIKAYFENLPKVTGWIGDTQFESVRSAKTVTPTGRVRYLPNALAIDDYTKEKAARQGVNTVIQGGASDITLDSIIKVFWFLNSNGYKTRLCGTVHDSILMYFREEELHILKTIKTMMEVAPAWLNGIPLVVDIKLGHNWCDMKEVSGFYSDGFPKF